MLQSVTRCMCQAVPAAMLWALCEMAQFTYVVITISHSSGAGLELTQHCFLHMLIWNWYCTSTSWARATLLFLGDGWRSGIRGGIPSRGQAVLPLPAKTLCRAPWCGYPPRVHSCLGCFERRLSITRAPEELCLLTRAEGTSPSLRDRVCKVQVGEGCQHHVFSFLAVSLGLSPHSPQSAPPVPVSLCHPPRVGPCVVPSVVQPTLSEGHVLSEVSWVILLPTGRTENRKYSVLFFPRALITLEESLSWCSYVMGGREATLLTSQGHKEIRRHCP